MHVDGTVSHEIRVVYFCSVRVETPVRIQRRFMRHRKQERIVWREAAGGNGTEYIHAILVINDTSFANIGEVRI